MVLLLLEQEAFYSRLGSSENICDITSAISERIHYVIFALASSNIWSAIAAVRA